MVKAGQASHAHGENCREQKIQEGQPNYGLESLHNTTSQWVLYHLFIVFALLKVSNGTFAVANIIYSFG